MAVHDGCKSNTKTPILEERDCPVCGEPIEVFTKMGRILEDSQCECGYVMKAEDPLSYKTRFEMLQEAEVERVNAQSRGIE